MVAWRGCEWVVLCERDVCGADSDTQVYTATEQECDADSIKTMAQS